MQQVLSSGQEWTHLILSLWIELSQTALQVKSTYLSKWDSSSDKIKDEFRNEDQSILNLYIAQLIGLWLELYPKIYDRTDSQFSEEFIKKFKSFKRYHEDPSLLLKKEYRRDISDMEMCIREAIEKLGITRYEV